MLKLSFPKHILFNINCASEHKVDFCYCSSRLRLQYLPKPHNAFCLTSVAFQFLIFNKFRVELSQIKGKVIPLQARSGPEVG